MNETSKTVALFTVGCKLNQYETQGMGELLEKAGFLRVDFQSKADVYIVNTCTVTAQSDYSSRQALFRAKKRSPDSKIIMTGCYAELEPNFLKTLAGVSLVISNEQKKNIAQIVSNLFNSEKRITPALELKVSSHFGHTRGLVKIQDGCNQSCSYCVIPFARGKERSKDPFLIVEEIKNLAENDFKEVVLTGVHVGRYDFDGMDLVGLTEKILASTQVKRLRYSSIEPNEITDDLINLIASEKRICRHLHIPLQSGEDKILQAMNRSYSTEYYQNLVTRLVNKTPELTIGADVIVGFPGETEEEFQNSCKFISSLPLSYLHVFSYSDRKRTKASLLPDRIPPLVIHRRSQRLHRIGKEKWEKVLDACIGRELEVLIEKTREKKSGKLIGLSDNYIRVLLDGNDFSVNQIIPVKIMKREGKFLLGEKAYQQKL
jgi:threonylcarbamoyladenosine tRNA methylthiotransferase MtaB